VQSAPPTEPNLKLFFQTQYILV